jgi:alanyl-tRNA synthetase
MKTDELREKYLSFFETKGHARRPSDVLVPTWDPSVLFTPAGMNQFKDHFLGKVKLDFTRATTCQKCLRTGDIEDVGRTEYHHTFFEMLGNFSFGDYFKREAIHWAWEFLTEKRWLGLEPSRLSVSVYVDDNEAAKIWSDEIHVPLEKIERMGEDDNFWPASAPSQGPDGVCGPCSEIFYHPPRGKSVEIWNLVFTQFNRVGPPPNNLRSLPSKNIDTGMGLERTAAALQGVDTNYHIDILRPIVEAAAEVCHVKYDPASDNGRRLRRITDHVRACAFAVHENVYPGPNKEKYVIKRLLRRAVLDGHQMGIREPFLFQLVPKVADIMRVPYPELLETAKRVADVIRKEEENFFGTIDAGLNRIERIFDEMRRGNRMTVSGGEAAELYQTFGVPPELFETMAAERSLAFDWDGFRHEMKLHGETSGKQQVEVFKSGPIESLKRAVQRTEFLGYTAIEATAEIKGIVADNKLHDHYAVAGDVPVILVLDRSPFYGESGGQVGDTGEISAAGMRFEVTDTQKDGELILHHGRLVAGQLRVCDKVTAKVDAARRQAIRRAHSATHILHHALQTHVGRHAQQQGSKVDADWLRFDFTNLSPVGGEALAAIEDSVHAKVAAAEPVKWEVLPLAEARKAGAMMLFGEKYPDPVRMVSMGAFSRELCGGTHLDNTGEVGAFEITSEEAVSAGVRRITALTGRRAEEHSHKAQSALAEMARVLGVSPLDVPAATAALAQTVRDLKKQLAGGGKAAAKSMQAKTAAPITPSAQQIKAALQEAARTLNVSLFDAPQRAAALLAEAENLRRQAEEQAATAGEVSADSVLASAQTVGGVRVVAVELPGGTANTMRQLIDQLRKSASPIAVLLASRQGADTVTLVAGLSRDLVERGFNAGNWVRDVAKIVGGSGGGKPDLAQAGGKQPEKIGEALTVAKATISEQLAR